MRIIQIMHRGVETASPDTTLFVLAKIMRDSDIGAVPICEKGRLTGIVTDRDVTVRAIANGKDIAAMKARDVMTQDVAYCRESEDADDAVRIMETRRIRRLPVLDDKDKLVGMVSLGDVSAALPREITAEVVKSVSAHHA